MAKEGVKLVDDVVTSVLNARHRLQQACVDLRSYSNASKPHSLSSFGSSRAERHAKYSLTSSDDTADQQARVCVQELHAEIDELCYLIRSIKSSFSRLCIEPAMPGSPQESCVTAGDFEDGDESISEASVRGSPVKQDCVRKEDLVTNCDYADGSESGSCVTENNESEEEWEDCEEGDVQSDSSSSSSSSDGKGTDMVKEKGVTMPRREGKIDEAWGSVLGMSGREGWEKERVEWESEREEIRQQVEWLHVLLAKGAEEREREEEEIGVAEEERRRDSEELRVRMEQLQAHLANVALEREREGESVVAWMHEREEILRELEWLQEHLERVAEEREREEEEVINLLQEWEEEREEVRQTISNIERHLKRAEEERQREREREEERRKEAWIRCARVAARERERLLQAAVAGRLGCSRCCRCLTGHEMIWDGMTAGPAIPAGKPASRQPFSSTPRTRSLHDGWLSGQRDSYRTTLTACSDQSCQLAPGNATGLPPSADTQCHSAHYSPTSPLLTAGLAPTADLGCLPIPFSGTSTWPTTLVTPGIEVRKECGRQQSRQTADVVMNAVSRARDGAGNNNQHQPGQGSINRGARGGKVSATLSGIISPAAAAASVQPSCRDTRECAHGETVEQANAASDPLRTPGQHVRHLSALWGLQQRSREAGRQKSCTGGGEADCKVHSSTPLHQQQGPGKMPAGSLQAILGCAKRVGKENHELGRGVGCGAQCTADSETESIAGSIAEFEVESSADSRAGPEESVVEPVRSPQAAFEAMRLMDELVL